MEGIKGPRGSANPSRCGRLGGQARHVDACYVHHSRPGCGADSGGVGSRELHAHRGHLDVSVDVEAVVLAGQHHGPVVHQRHVKALRMLHLEINSQI